MNIRRTCTSNSYFYKLWQARRGVNHPDLATPWLTFPTGMVVKKFAKSHRCPSHQCSTLGAMLNNKLGEGDHRWSPLDVLLSSLPTYRCETDWLEDRRESIHLQVENCPTPLIVCVDATNDPNEYWSPLLPNTYSVITYCLLYYILPRQL